MNLHFDMSIPDKTYNRREWTLGNPNWKNEREIIAQDEQRPWVDIVHILKNAPVSVNTDDIFCYLVKNDGFMSDLTNQRKKQVMSTWKSVPHNCELSIYPDFSHSILSLYRRGRHHYDAGGTYRQIAGDIR